MHEQATACPHCGAKLDHDRPAGGKLGKLSREEARALLVMNHPEAGEREPQNMFATLVLPHPRNRGGTRTAELALTAVGFPIVAAGVPMTLAAGRHLRRVMAAPSGEYVAVGLATVLGGPATVLGLMSLGLAAGWAFAIAGAMVAALVVRAMIRREIDDAKSSLLSELDGPPPPPPTAIVVRAPPRTSPALAPLAGAEPERAAGEAAVDDAAGPRLLR